LPVLTLSDSLIDRRLKTSLVDHQAGSGQAGNLPGSELQVMWFSARLSQVRDDGVGASNALSDEL